MNPYAAAAIFCAGTIFGIAIMCYSIIRGHANAMAAFSKSPEDK